MATLKGKNAFSNVNLLGTIRKEVYDKNGEHIGYMIDFEVDQSHLADKADAGEKGQSNPHLTHRVYDKNDGTKGYSRDEFYTLEQVDQFKEVGQTCDLGYGKTGIALQGNLMSRTYTDTSGVEKKKLVVMTKSSKEGEGVEKYNAKVSLKPNPNIETLTKDTFEKQREVTNASREYVKAKFSKDNQIENDKQEEMEQTTGEFEVDTDMDLPF